MEGSAVASDIYQGIDEATRFLAALFPESDVILFRPIETWIENTKKRSRVAYKLIMHSNRDVPGLSRTLRKLWRIAPEQHLNQFFGVCPNCPGTMRKYCTRTKGKLRTRYLKCDRCKTTDQEVFRVDDRGRPIFECCTPLGNNNIAND